MFSGNFEYVNYVKFLELRVSHLFVSMFTFDFIQAMESICFSAKRFVQKIPVGSWTNKTGIPYNHVHLGSFFLYLSISSSDNSFVIWWAQVLFNSVPDIDLEWTPGSSNGWTVHSTKQWFTAMSLFALHSNFDHSLLMRTSETSIFKIQKVSMSGKTCLDWRIILPHYNQNSSTFCVLTVFNLSMSSHFKQDEIKCTCRSTYSISCIILLKRWQI